MLSKQLTTYQQKTDRGSEIIAIYQQRCEYKQALINLLDDELKNELPAIKRLELEIQRLDIMESLIENKVSMRIKMEIQAEDMKSHELFASEKRLLEKEMDEGLFETALEKIKKFVVDLKRKNKNADTSQLTGLIHKATTELSSDEKLDNYRQMKPIYNKIIQQNV